MAIKDNEKVYDEQVNPLVEQIIKICQAHGIPMFATFQYGPEDENGIPLCTTAVPAEGQANVFKQMVQLAKGEVSTVPSIMAFTITTTKS